MKRLFPTTETTPSKIGTWNTDEKTPEKRSTTIPETIHRVSPFKVCPKRSEPLSDSVKTLVFFDLETSGLIQGDNVHLEINKLKSYADHTATLKNLCLTTRDSAYPHILEMSFIAVPRDIFEDHISLMQMKNRRGEKDLVQHIATNTHTRLINPSMNQEEWAAYERKRNANRVFVHSMKTLKHMKTFAEEWTSVRSFLDGLEKPIAIVAHNGIKFDFRVLYGEMKKSGILNESIPGQVLFVDSFAMAMKLDQTYFDTCATICANVNFPLMAEMCGSREENENDDKESTPNLVHFEKGHPARFLNWPNFSIAKQRRIKKEYFKKGPAGYSYDRLSARSTSKYTLSALYNDIVSHDGFEAHFAESDAKALMQVCLGYGEEFLNYVDEFAAEFPF